MKRGGSGISAVSPSPMLLTPVTPLHSVAGQELPFPSIQERNSLTSAPLMPLAGPLPSLKSTTLAPFPSDTFPSSDKFIEPISKEPTKPSIIAPVTVPPSLLSRPRTESLESIKKDNILTSSEYSLNHKVFSGEEFANSTKQMSAEVFSTPEMKKSKSLTRKIKELSTTTPSGALPVALGSKDNTPSRPSLSSIHSSARTIPKTSTPLSALKGTSIAALDKSLIPVDDDMIASSQIAPQQLFFQHSSLPKSVGTPTSTANNSGIVTSKSAPSSSVKTTQPRSRAPTPTEFVFVPNDHPVEITKTVENDKILQERLEQAKALNRKDENGATMHSFALWKPKTIPLFQPSTDVAEMGFNDVDSAAFSAASTNQSSKLSQKRRGSRAAVDVQQQGTPFDEPPTDPNSDKSSMLLVDHEDSDDDVLQLSKNKAMVAEVPYSDDEFVAADEFDRLVQDTGAGAEGENADCSMLSLGATLVRPLHLNALRSRIDEAKHIDESCSTQPAVNNTALETSHASNGKGEPSLLFDGEASDIHEIFDEDIDNSVGHNSADDPLELSRTMPTGFGSMSSIPTIFSRSGPAVLGGLTESDTSLDHATEPPAAPNKQRKLRRADFEMKPRRASTETVFRPDDGKNESTVGRLRSQSHTHNDVQLTAIPANKDINKENSLLAAGALGAMQSRKTESSSRRNVPVRQNESKPSKYQMLKALRHSSQSSTSVAQQLEKQVEQLSKVTLLSNHISDVNSSNISVAAVRLTAATLTVTQTKTVTNTEISHAQNDNLHSNRDVLAGSPTLSELSEEEEPSRIDTNPCKRAEENCGEAFGDADSECPSPLRWKKGEAIGEGTFGKVFKGLNEKTGELLAIKQIPITDGSQAEADELRREINVMWDLDHPNIVRYLGTTKTDRFLFIVMEFVTGGSIASMIKQFGALTENLLRRFSYHIISGVAYLHEKGIIHRDIKGANILVTDAGIAKLADFGCSKRMAGMCTMSMEESMGTLKGSVPWMAPEVIRQSGHGRSSDIWSFGATMIEMTTGRPPWSEYSNNLAAMFHVATSKTPPAIPSHLSPDCVRFMSQCLVVDPEGRATAAQLLHESEFLRIERDRIALSNGMIKAR